MKANVKGDALPATLSLSIGARIYWQGMDGVRGSATIQAVAESAGRRWFWVEWHAVSRWVSELIVITMINEERK